METIFEYGRQIVVKDRKSLEAYLLSLWKEYKDLWSTDYMDSFNNINKNYQPFLTFDGNLAKANNYVGFIHNNNDSIQIYPKVFQNIDHLNKDLIHRHIFFWFSYCRKIKFPFNQSFLDNFEIDNFPEIIIYLIGRQIFETIRGTPYLAYESIEEALATPRGRINFDRNIKSLTYGRNNLIDCDYEPFIYDNRINRIIKYCVRLLLSQSLFSETQRILNEIIFYFDEVEDQVCTINHLNTIRISSFFEEYEGVMHCCRMILDNQIYSHADYEMKNWSLLFPMEYVFEDFISGFLITHFSKEFEIEPQKSELYLHQNPKTFNLKHDILVTNKKTGEEIIIDTKYKPRWSLKDEDYKRGVSQSDMYQMISYAYRRGTSNVILIYPNTSSKLTNDYLFIIPKANSKDEVKIKVIDVPFWSEHDHLSIQNNLIIKLDEALKKGFD